MKFYEIWMNLCEFDFYSFKFKGLVTIDKNLKLIYSSKEYSVRYVLIHTRYSILTLHGNYTTVRSEAFHFVHVMS
jgi:hypothetical protein